ncbi:MAG: tetratricopeptide repeat protein [Planctomycetota bacterium]
MIDLRSSRALVGLSLALLSLAGCRSLPAEPGHSTLAQPSGELPRELVLEQIAAIESDLASDAPWHATRRASELRGQRRLDASAADRIDVLLEEAVLRASESADRAKDFESIEANKLPRRSRAIFSVAHARALIAEDECFDAYLEIRDLEQVHRTHHLRTQAGDVVFDAGVRLAEDDSRFLLIFSRSTNAPTVLEYMFLQHPSHPRTPEAYLWLAGEYESRGNLTSAIEHYEELLLYHPRSPGSVEAEARVPQLRLDRLLRLDYDRQDLLLARDGFERWLERHGSRPEVTADLVAEVERDLAETYRRLAESDLLVADFYQRVDEPIGQQLHAERARGLARQAGSEELERRAIALIDAVAGDGVLAPRLSGATEIPEVGPLEVSE